MHSILYRRLDIVPSVLQMRGSYRKTDHIFVVISKFISKVTVSDNVVIAVVIADLGKHPIMRCVGYNFQRLSSSNTDVNVVQETCARNLAEKP